MTTVAVVCTAGLTVLLLTHCRPRAARLVRFRTREPVKSHVGATRLRGVARVTTRRVIPLAAGAALFGLFAASIAVVAIALWPRFRQAREHTRARNRAVLAYPDFVDMLVLSIKSGCSPRQALEALLEAAPPAARPGVAAILQRADTGQRFAEAVVALQEPAPRGLGPIAQPLVDALALADRYGTPLPPILDRLADEARAQRRRNAEAAARRLPIQLSFPLVGCTLPSFVLLTVVPLMAGTFSSLRGLPR